MNALNALTPRATRALFVASVAMITLSLILSGVNVATVLSAPLASAVTVPNLVGFEGFLADANGNPVADGTYSLTFAVYGVDAGGTALWSETQSSVQVTKGLYAVTLGSQTSFPSNLFDGDRWIGVTVDGGTEITPRTRVSSVPFALNAQSATSADSAPWSGITSVPAGFADGVDNDTTYTAGSGLNLTGNQFNVNTTVIQGRVTGTCAAGSSIRQIAVDGTVTCETDDGTVTGSGTSGQVALWNGATVLTGNSGITASGNSLTVGGGLNVGSSTGAGTGAVRYSGNLQPLRNSANETGYIFVPLTTSGWWTSTSYDGDAVAIGTYTIDVSTFSGAPSSTAHIKAYFVALRAKWSSASDSYYAVLKTSGSDAGASVGGRAAVANIFTDSYGIIAADANGDFVLRVGGANTTAIYIEIYGYWT